MPAGSTKKEERKYEHIKESLTPVSRARDRESGGSAGLQRPHPSLGLADRRGDALHRLAVARTALGVQVPPEDQEIQEAELLGGRSAVEVGMTGHARMLGHPGMRHIRHRPDAASAIRRA